jgi:hypothetical protein
MRLLLPLLLLGCAREDEPPDDLAEPVVWLLANFDERDDELDPHLIDLADYALGLDPAAGWEQRAFAPAPLERSHVADLAGPPFAEDQATLAVIGRSEQALDAHRRSVEVPDRRCVDAPTAASWLRTVEFGGGCFAAGACDELWARDALEGDDLPSALVQRFRVLQLSDDRDVLLGRAVLPGDATPTRTTHLYALAVWVSDPEDPRLTWRIDATWQVGAPTSPREDWHAATGASLDAAHAAADAYLAQSPPPDCSATD